MAATPSSLVSAQNKFSLPDATLPASATGSHIFVRCEHDVEVRGFSLSLRYDPAALAVTEVTTAGTSAEAAEYSHGYHQDGKLVHWVILDLTEPITKTLGSPPGGGVADHTLMRLTVDVLAAAGTVTEVAFEDGLAVPLGGGAESPTCWNVLVDEEGETASPLQLEGGQITVVSPATDPVPPLARAGADQFVPEASAVTLDASASESPVGAPLTFLWQVDPLAQDVTGTDSAQLAFTAPPVTADTPLSFQVTVSDGTSSSTDQVSVFVVDMDSRTAGFSRAPAGSVGRIESEDRAVVFAGRMEWASPYESAYCSRVKFTATGKGDESLLLGDIALHADSNGNGVFDAEDRQLGDGAPLSADDGPVEFLFLDTLESGVPQTYFLVADVPRPSAIPGTAGFLATILLAAIFLARNKIGRAWAPALRGGLSLVLVAAMGLSASLALGACSGGGVGSSDRQVRFSILDPLDVGVQGLSSGVNVTVGNLPFDGPSLKV